jgi:hypothetical protein
MKECECEKKGKHKNINAAAPMLLNDEGVDGVHLDQKLSHVLARCTSVVFQSDDTLSRTALARLALARMSATLAVQAKDNV